MKPKVIVERLEFVLGFDSGPKRLRDILEEQLRVFFGLSPLEAAEQAEKLEARIGQLIGQRNDEELTGGTMPVLTMVGSSLNTVAGSCHVFPTDPPEIAAAKRNRLQVRPLLDAIQQLTFREFELFSARVLTELGAQAVTVTPHSNDQGIDFYGTVSLGALQGAPPPFFQLAHDVQLRLAGQAKHYPETPLGPEVVRELVGAIALARHKTFSVETTDLFEDLELKAFNPLVALLFTTGRLTSGAADLAYKAGIIARSGQQIAMFLADRGVGMEPTTSGPRFNPTTFRNWLHRT